MTRILALMIFIDGMRIPFAKSLDLQWDDRARGIQILHERTYVRRAGS
jgi:hypothetical protein